MNAVNLAQRNKHERRHAENDLEKVVRDCIDQMHWLHGNNNQRLQQKVAVVFAIVIRSAGYDIPYNIDIRNVDDLSCILIASISDWYYRTAHNGSLDSEMTDQATTEENLDSNMTNQAIPTEILTTSSSLKSKVKPPKAPSVSIKRVCINLITHLSLLGGRPANCNKFNTHNKVSFHDFMGRLSKARIQSHLQYPERLGFLTDEQMKNGKWLSQIATGMETLDLERTAWCVVDENSYKMLSCGENERIFLDTRKFNNFNPAIPTLLPCPLMLIKRHNILRNRVISTEGPRYGSNIWGLQWTLTVLTNHLAF
jgi:hypothetical protein